MTCVPYSAPGALQVLTTTRWGARQAAWWGAWQATCHGPSSRLMTCRDFSSRLVTFRDAIFSISFIRELILLFQF